MSTQLIPFSFETHEIRVTDQNGSPWFVLRDLLDAMESKTTTTAAVESIKQGLGDGFVSDIPIIDSLGREQNTLVVAESAATYLLSRSSTDKGRELNRFIHVDVLPSIRQTGSYTAPKTKPTLDVILLKNRQAKSTLNLYLSAAKLLGTDAPMARAIAVDAVKRQTGVDFQPLIAGNVIEEKPMTPTELGKQRGWTAKGTNLQLAIAGLQTKTDDGDWMPTERGRPYCTCNPYKAPHSPHTGYRILWYRTVLDGLPTSCQEAA